VVSKRTLNLLI